ncbi:hypothetical protein [Eubacterium sp.]|uniref:hypothetical protein n=1 Tax=Eubacterium sp. TaxID=142586 RepID=UPI002A834353|nr:hypothetical protein [Eubacterium sp.]MDY3812316.1 hypothetical protein [Eubacterium sp.]
MKKKNIKLPIAFMVAGLLMFVSAFLVSNEDLLTVLFLAGPIVFVVSLIVLIVRVVKNGRASDTQAEQLRPTVKMLYQSGLRGVEPSPVVLELDESVGKILIHAKPKYCNGVSEFSLDVDKITAAGVEKNVSYEPSSGMGRAIVGGALFGVAGAMIGAATKKDKKVTDVAYVIRYKDENVPKFLVLKDLTINEGKKFFDKVNTLININKANADGSIDL